MKSLLTYGSLCSSVSKAQLRLAPRGAFSTSQKMHFHVRKAQVTGGAQRSLFTPSMAARNFSSQENKTEEAEVVEPQVEMNQ